MRLIDADAIPYTMLYKESRLKVKGTGVEKLGVWKDKIDTMPTIKQPDLTYIIFETLAECGIYGEEATIKLIGILKRLGRNDLLPPCVR